MLSEDFTVMYKKNDKGENKLMGGGYVLNSCQSQSGGHVNIMETLNTDTNEYTGGGNRVSKVFENLAVPAGLFYINQTTLKSRFPQIREHYDSHHDMLPHDIYDKLMNLVDIKQHTKHNTKRKRTKLSHSKTKKHK